MLRASLYCGRELSSSSLLLSSPSVLGSKEPDLLLLARGGVSALGLSLAESSSKACLFLTEECDNPRHERQYGQSWERRRQLEAFADAARRYRRHKK